MGTDFDEDVRLALVQATKDITSLRADLAAARAEVEELKAAARPLLLLDLPKLIDFLWRQDATREASALSLFLSAYEDRRQRDIPPQGR